MQNKKADRAKQFLMFDSLKGFHHYLNEKEEVVVSKKELMSDAIDELNWKIQQISVGEIIEIVYFDHGKYKLLTGMVAKIDLEYKKEIQIVKKIIPIKNIISMNCLL